MDTITISIAKSFSIYPGGRYKMDGVYSGEEFRDDLLLPLLKKNKKVIIDFDGTKGYGVSFLEEVFGGLIRSNIPKEKIDRLITFKSEDQTIIDDINEYINDAIASCPVM